MTRDLALLADRRAGIAALLGTLLLEEPGPHLADLVSAVPSLGPLADGDPVLPSEYERVFLRGVPLHESVFRSDDGQQGGEHVSVLAARYVRLGFDEAQQGRWRVAGIDHIGLHLRCLAELCRAEAKAWRSGTPDEAVAAIEVERSFLADHVAPWATVALEAAEHVATGGPYQPLLHAAIEFLDEEYNRLRPAPDLGRVLAAAGDDGRHAGVGAGDGDGGIAAGRTGGTVATALGPQRLARVLLAPAACGAWIGRDTIAAAAAAIGAPWRPLDTRGSLRLLISSALDSGELAVLLGPLAQSLRAAADHHQASALASPGNADTSQRWASVAGAMAARLERIAADGLADNQSGAAETLTVAGADTAELADTLDRIVVELRASGFTVDRHATRYEPR